MHFLKRISLTFANKQGFEILIHPAIQLVLVTTSKIFLNHGISENQLTEVKENVTICLKAMLKKITLDKMTRSRFNVQYEDQGQPEMQVGDILIA